MNIFYKMNSLNYGLCVHISDNSINFLVNKMANMPVYVVPVKPFQPSIMFACKVGAYPSGTPLRCCHLG